MVLESSAERHAESAELPRETHALLGLRRLHDEMALSALAPPTALDDDEADDYRLHEVWLHDFKSYAGAVRVGPFHPRLNVVVGPNGCGKSCLVSGIGFALGLAHERADVLKARVGAQTIAVSHRPPMVEAACTLVGAYARPGASGSASLRFG